MSKTKSAEYHFIGSLRPLHNISSYLGIVVPVDIMEKIGLKGRLRVKGSFNDHPFDLAIQHLKTGERYLMVSAALRRSSNISEGMSIEVKFLLSDPTVVDLPEELMAVLAQDDDANKIWESFTPGRQRSLAHYVNSVKNIDSRIKRALELAAKAKTGELFIQKKLKNSDKIP